MIWVCDDCLTEMVDDPHGHSDWGGSIHVYGPDCPECHKPMEERAAPMAETTPLTDSTLADFEVMADWGGLSPKNVYLLTAEVRRLRAEWAELPGLIDALLDGHEGDAQLPYTAAMNRLCELFPELKVTP